LGLLDLQNLWRQLRHLRQSSQLGLQDPQSL
jgi:hypothetical protein